MQLYIFADDTAPRYLTSTLLLDYDTVAAGDKFGNFFTLRLPADASAQVCACVCGEGGGGQGCWFCVLVFV